MNMIFKDLEEISNAVQPKQPPKKHGNLAGSSKQQAIPHSKPTEDFVLSGNSSKENFSSVMTTETCFRELEYSSCEKGRPSDCVSNEINYSQVGKSLASYLYVFGGFVTNSSLSVERLDLQREHWDQPSRISKHRAKFGAVQINSEKLLIMGGKQEGKRVDSCEEFDMATGVWSPGKIKLSCPKSGFGATIFKSNVPFFDSAQ